MELVLARGNRVRERENAADQMMALSANHNLHLTQVEPQQLIKAHFFLLSFFTLQVDICF